MVQEDVHSIGCIYTVVAKVVHRSNRVECKALNVLAGGPRAKHSIL